MLTVTLPGILIAVFALPEAYKGTYMIDDAIDKLGIGKIQVLAILFAYLVWVSEKMIN